MLSIFYFNRTMQCFIDEHYNLIDFKSGPCKFKKGIGVKTNGLKDLNVTNIGKS